MSIATDNELITGDQNPGFSERASTSQARMDVYHAFLLRFHGPIFRYLWQASGSKEDAEDLTSQTLLVAFKRREQFRGDGPLQAWVFRVAQRELLRHLRRKRLAEAFSIRKSPEPPTPSPNDGIVVSQALAKLSLDQRTAFLMVEVEGLSVEEAAVALRIPPGTVKSRCFHARRRLQTLLAPAFFDQAEKPL